MPRVVLSTSSKKSCILLLLLPSLVSAFFVRTPLPMSTVLSHSRRTVSCMAASTSPATKLRNLLQQNDILIMPCCYDGLTARLVEQHGFPLTFMTGFGVSAARGHPDTQLLSYAEMVDNARQISEALHTIPCIGDGDTGYGNAVNVKRTVGGYAQAGLAGIMIEDQVAPKKCGHTKGKSCVSREEAFARVQAAVDARNEGADILIMARTDARAGLGMDEAIYRCQKFREIGADITFLEAPHSEEEMRRYCQEVEGPKLANMLQNGRTPVLPPAKLQEMGYTIVAYPLALLSAGIKAMRTVLTLAKDGKEFEHLLADFEETKAVVGFPAYYAAEEKAAADIEAFGRVEEARRDGK
ncbi:carboxyvinyl-carboxyphosphonate phosphorylmutase [Nannochloropsis gaditana]|uniref:Carboxyvinyl-carboxyphosphonate phosphorylmutase n=1 Tax=Nannochloropsis gaditana TaxID=72520 RepID=W7TTL0_9STRA|nr:carboxyvinyl-carboxyphosphonate phosphorylmutase [Nannochloropsis gaditana]